MTRQRILWTLWIGLGVCMWLGIAWLALGNPTPSLSDNCSVGMPPFC